MPEWECGERCEEGEITWAATTSERATMQAVGVAMLNAAYSACVREQMVAERGASAAAGLQVQGPEAGDVVPGPVLAPTHTTHNTRIHGTHSTHTHNTHNTHNTQVHDTQHTGARVASSDEQAASASAGQADGEEQARHAASQEISNNNQASADEERSPGTRRTDQHEHDDYTTQNTAGQRHSQGQHVVPGGQPAHHGQ